MIPLRLRLKNFLSYREMPEPLDFESFRLACLSGDNGHGKSALLDAVTWAFWGRSRAKTEDELFSHGATDMEVELDFQLGESVFRVLRKRSRRTTTSIPTLELQVRDGESFRPMTGNSVRETERAIIRLLRLDYETFVNSAFLLQGKADSFTTKTAGERKEVLAEILNLEVYDRLEVRARANARERRALMMQIDVEVARIDEELTRKPEYQADIQRYELETRDLSGQLEKLALELQLANAELEKLNATAERAKSLSKAITEDRMQLHSDQKRLEGLEQRLQSYERLRSGRQAIEAGFEALTRAKAVQREQGDRLVKLTPLLARREELNRQIDRKRAAAQSEIASLAERVALLQSQSSNVATLKGSLVNVQKENAASEKARRGMDLRWVQVKDDARKNSEDAGRLDGLKREMQEIKQAIDLLSGAARCPVCGQQLSERDRDNLHREKNALGKNKGDEYRALKKTVEQRTGELAGYAAQLEEEDRLLKNREGQIAGNLGKVRQQLADAGAAAEQAALAEELLTERKALFDGKQYAGEDFEALADLNLLIDALPVDHAALEAAGNDVKELAGFEEKQRQLTNADEQVNSTRNDVKYMTDQIAVLEKRIEKNTKELGAATVPADAKSTLEKKIAGIRDQQSALTTQRNTAENHLGRAQQQLDHCGRLENERAKKLEDHKQAAAERSSYEELATAFGKRGVQAMIIEAFLPEIERDANEILQRMTDNRMTIRLETQRQGRTNNAIETLDIQIGDELGTRNYEMFSGGEAFRINFAIRVALAKSLTRRAGAKLETLVIDEGFGTQDASGRDRLVEAIHAIEDQFEKIIVVTHIDELKEVFPTRINVVKTDAGSTFSITHR